MADELNLQVRFNRTDGFKTRFAPETYQGDANSIDEHGTMVNVGFAAEEDMPTGDVDATVSRIALVKNMDATNYVTYGPKSGGSMVAFGRLLPGITNVVTLEPNVIMRWQANTAACRVRMLIVDGA